MPSEKILNAKKQVVDELKDKIGQAKSIVLVNYLGLTVEEVTDLRNRLRKAGVDYKVLKNTMITFAAKANQLEALQPYLNGPTAVAFSYDDEIAPSKILSDYAKENEKLEIKAGVVSGKVVSSSEIKVLASLPSKTELLAKFVGCLNSPLQGFVSVMSGNLRGFVNVLDQVAKQRA